MAGLHISATAPTNGQVPVYSSTTKSWDPASSITSASKFTRTATSSASYSVLAEQQVIAVTSQPTTVTLRAAATAGAGAWITIQDAAGTAYASNITIDANSSETIDGMLVTKIRENYGSVTLFCDGTGWVTIDAVHPQDRFVYDPTGTLRDGLIAYWPMWEASGVRMDLLGNIPLVDTTYLTFPSRDGRVSKAVDFTAGGQRLAALDNPHMISGAGAFTLAGWAKLDTIASTQFLLGWDDIAVQQSFYLAYVTGTDVMQFWMSNNDLTGAGSTSKNSAAGFAVDTWYFLAIQKASGGTMTLRVDTTDVTQAHAHNIANASCKFTFGGLDDTGLPLNGAMCDWGYWNRVLTSTELTNLKNGTTGNRLLVGGR